MNNVRCFMNGACSKLYLKGYLCCTPRFVNTPVRVCHRGIQYSGIPYSADC